MSNGLRGRPIEIEDKTFLKVAMSGKLKQALSDHKHDTGINEGEIVRRALKEYLGL